MHFLLVERFKKVMGISKLTVSPETASIHHHGEPNPLDQVCSCITICRIYLQMTDSVRMRSTSNFENSEFRFLENKKRPKNRYDMQNR